MLGSKIKSFFVILFPFLFSLNAYAGKSTDSSGNLVYSFLVDNPSMVDAYFNIFNAMAMFFQSNDYLELLKTVFLLGGLTVFFTGVMKVYQGGDAKGSLGEFVKYMILGTALLTIIFSHKSQMIIKTNQLPSFCPSGPTSSASIIASAPTTTGVVVGNIPEVLAWTFSLINEVGRETTRLATMGFTAVDANLTTYTTRSDYASYLQGVGSILSLKLNDLNSNYDSQEKASLQQGLETLFRDCIAAPASNAGNNGSLVMTAFTNTGNLKQTLTDYIGSGQVNTYKNPTDTSTITTLLTNFSVGGVMPKDMLATINGEIFTCGQIFNTVNNYFNSLIAGDKLVCSKNLKDYWNPQTMAIFTGDSTIIAEPQAKMIALNAALANEVMDSKNNIAPAELSFASGKSTAEFVTNSLGTGYYMAQMLPYLQMGMRAVMYAFFPFVFIVILLPGGIKVLVSYLQTLIWIELWSPTAAVLNMFLSLMATDKFADMYQKQGVNATQGLQVFSDSAMLASVAGYLYASVPALTWLILKGSGQMLGNITGAIGARMTSNLDSDRILKDKEQIAGNRRLNQERKARGQEMISLAEQDRLSSQINSWENAGVLDQKIQNKDKLFGASAAKTMLDIQKNDTNEKLFLSSPDSQRNTGALVAKQKEDIKGLTEEKLRTGELDRNGQIVNSQNEKIAESGGQKGAQTKLATKEEMTQTLRHTGGDLNKAAQALGGKNFENTVKAMKEEEYQALVHKVNPNDRNALAKMRVGTASTDALGNTISNNTEESFQDQVIGKKDANGNIQNLRPKVQNVSTADATNKAVQNQTNQVLRDTFSKGERVESAVVGESVKIGEANYKTTSLKKGLEILAADKGHEDSKKASELLASLNDPKGSKSSKMHALSEAAGLKSIQGAAAGMYQNLSGDENAERLTKEGITASIKGGFDANKTLTENDYYSGSKTGQGGVFNELKKHEGGNEAIDKTIDQLQKHGSDLSKMNEKDSSGNLTQEALNQRRLVAESTMKNISAPAETYSKSLKALEQIVREEKGATIGENANANIVNESVKTGSTNNIEAVFGKDVMEASKTIEGGLKIASTPAEIVKTITNNYKAAGKVFTGGADLTKKLSKFGKGPMSEGDTKELLEFMKSHTK